MCGHTAKKKPGNKEHTPNKNMGDLCTFGSRSCCSEHARFSC